MRSFFLTDRFFWLLGSIAALFALSFAFGELFSWAQLFLGVAFLLVLADAVLLYGRRRYLSAERSIGKMFSLSDPNSVAYTVRNHGPLRLNITLIDELPAQFQARHFALKFALSARNQTTLHHELRPLTRGAYAFGHLHLFVQTALGLVERRFTFELSQEVAVYPSVLQMRRYELMALGSLAREAGIKRVRRVGHSYEFEHIKNYTQGDDYRSINWKASGRRGGLMVNQYEDERSQQVFCLLDKSRIMSMPFNGLSLLDYAINASLTIRVVLK